MLVLVVIFLVTLLRDAVAVSEPQVEILGDVLFAFAHPQPPLTMEADHAHTTIAPEDPDAQATALSIDVPEDTGEGGKLRMIVQLVKRSFGVKDLAAMCPPNHLSDPTNVHPFSLFPGVSHSPHRC